LNDPFARFGKTGGSDFGQAPVRSWFDQKVEGPGVPGGPVVDGRNKLVASVHFLAF
jgi:hypothetical protein